MTEIIAAVVGAFLALIGGFAVWTLQDRAENKRIRREKMQELITAIHRVNLQVLRLDGKYGSPSAEQEMENSINEIQAIVTLYFAEFRPLSERVFSAFVNTTSGGSHVQLMGELRGLEQDLINVWEGSQGALSPQRKLPPI